MKNDALEERSTQDRAVSDLTRRAAEADSLEALFDEATELVADALDHHYCNVLEWQPDASELLLRSGVGRQDGSIGSATVTNDARSRAGHALESNEPVVVDELSSEQRFSGPEIPTSHDIHSGITTRIGPVEDPWGVLETHHTEHRSYAEHDVEFVQSVADVLYVAVERRNRDREPQASSNRSRKASAAPTRTTGFVDEPVGRTHHTTIEATPDPVMALDTTTNEVLDCNDAAVQLLGRSRDALVGTEGVSVHPEAETERYRAFIEDLKTNPRTVERFENGDPIEIETNQGTQVEVVLDAERIELPSRTVLLGIFRPVSERRWFEDSLAAINQASRDLADTETATEVAETAIDTAESVLERPFKTVYLYDESDGVLRRSASSSDAQDVIGTIPTSQLGDGIAWRAFEDGETRFSDDVRHGRGIYESWTNVGSELIVPLGDHGVFIAADTETDAFDDRLIELAERLAGCAADALDRVKHEESMVKTQGQLRAENQQFEAVKPVGKAAIVISQSIVEATTRTEVESALCNPLTDIDDIAFAWVATPSHVDDELCPETWAGQEVGYLDTVDLELNESAHSGDPTTKAAATKSTVNVSNIADETTAGNWKRAALFRDFQSCLSVPITYHDGLYGVLSVYATQQDAFAPPVEQILEHVAQEAGYAINAVEIRNGALHSRVTELEFTVDDSMDTLYRAADELDCRIEHLNTIPQAKNQYLFEIAIEDVDVDAFEAVLDRSAAVESFSTRERGADGYDVVLTEQGLAGRVIELGGNPKRIVMDGAASRLTVELSNETNVRSFVQQLNDRDTVTLQSQKTRQHSELDESPAMTERLTDRQLEVVETTYQKGYFEQPRANTGEDVADALGISQPAFSTHLRKAEQAVVDFIVEQEPDET